MDNGISPSLPSPLSEGRIRARRLLTQLRSADSAVAATAAARFLALDSLAARSVPELLAERQRVRLKHALAVVAQEAGFASWAAFKTAAESGSPLAARVPEDELMYTRRHDVLLNRWFARYDEARVSLEAHGGYLLPYRHHFFICEAEGIRILGLDPDDPDWQRIAFDWIEPADREAWQRLRQKRLQVLALPPTG